jgi:hypothetical protein
MKWRHEIHSPRLQPMKAGGTFSAARSLSRCGLKRSPWHRIAHFPSSCLSMRDEVACAGWPTPRSANHSTCLSNPESACDTSAGLRIPGESATAGSVSTRSWKNHSARQVRVWCVQGRRPMSGAGRPRGRRNRAADVAGNATRITSLFEERIELWRSQSVSVSVARSVNQITARAARACSWKSSSIEWHSMTGSGFGQRLKGFSSGLEMRSIANFIGVCPLCRNLSQI